MQKVKHDFLKRAKRRLLAGVLAAAMAFTVVPTNVFAVEDVVGRNEQVNSETQNAETPKEETPKEETPKEETPKEETPKEETPKEETPKEETPKEETPKEETPKEETPKADPATAELALNAPAAVTPVATWADVAKKAVKGTDYSESGLTYTIKTATGLAWFANEVNVKKRDFATYTIKLEKEIILDSGLVTDYDKGTITAKNSWIPIGYIKNGDNDTKFAGIFDGDGHAVSGVKINGATTACQGLFGRTTKTAVVKNVSVVNSDINAKDFVGGVVGNNEGTVENCSTPYYIFDSKVTGGQISTKVGGVVGFNEGTVRNCSNSALVKGNYERAIVGGVVGVNRGTVTNCSSNGAASGTENNAKVGGVVGLNEGGTVKNCYNTGTVNGGNTDSSVGGVVGQNFEDNLNKNATVLNCYNTGDVTGGDKAYVGGVVGWNQKSTVTNCYNTGAVASAKAGGVVGHNGSIVEKCYYMNAVIRQGIGYNTITKDTTVGKSADEMQAEAFVKTLNANLDAIKDTTLYTWKLPQYPTVYPIFTDILWAEPTLPTTWAEVAKKAKQGVDYIESADKKTYTIKTATGLAWFANDVSIAAHGYAGKTVVLANDIVLTSALVTNYDKGTITETNSWVPIGDYPNQFAGTFDGAGHTVSGVKINYERSSNLGLFGRIDESGTVKNVGVINSTITAGSFVGGVVGTNYRGKVINCYNTGTVKSLDNFAETGGVVGSNMGTVTNCYNTGMVTGNAANSVVGSVVGSNTVGGKVTNCYYLTGTAAIGIGNVATDVPENTLGMNANDMRGDTLLNNLNKNLDEIKDKTLYTWIAVAGSYPTLSTTLWTEPLPATWAEVAANVKTDGTDYEWNVGNTEVTIKTATGLAWVANQVNTNADNFGGKTVELAGDIDLNPADELVKGYSKNLTTDNSWTPIGSTTYKFAGTFDGKNHTVSGVKIKNANTDNQGLFGYISSTATVKNVGVIKTDITAGDNVGGVVGNNNGTVTNCYNTGAVTGASGRAYVGGVVGYNLGTVTNCYNTGAVTSTGGNAKVGGVVGYNLGTVTNSYNTGAVNGTGTANANVGGVVGNNGGTVKNCYNTGAVTGTSKVGGVVGNNTGTVEKCYYLTGTATIGIGNVATDVPENTLGMNANDMRGDTLLNNLNKNLDAIKDQTLYTWKAVTGSYPTLSTTLWTEKLPATWAEVAANVKTDGTDYEWNVGNTVVTIKTATGLAWVANQVNTNADNFGGKTVELAGDIDLNPADELVKGYKDALIDKNSWTPIGMIIRGPSVDDERPFAGTFDGKNHTVSGVKINNTAYNQGLFGVVAKGAVVQNVGVIDSDITAGNVVGGVVGWNDVSTVTNCYNTGVVTSASTGAQVGGVVGYSSGTVTNCYNTGAVKGTGDGAYVGSVVGVNNGTVKNCYNTGAVTGTSAGAYVGGVVGNNGYTVTNCYNTGEVKRAGSAGGVVGCNYSTVTNCYYLNITITNGIGGVTSDVPENTLGMPADAMQAETFVTKLNDNLDEIKDKTLYTWKAVTSSYPTLSTTLWTEKPTPTAANFTFTAPTPLVYDGKDKTATVVANTTAVGMGTITVKYYNGTTKLAAAPKDVGTYTVKIDVAKGTDYAAVNDLTNPSWTFTITAKELTVTMTATSKEYDGTTAATAKYSLTDVVGKDTVTATGTATFDNKNVGTDKDVTATAITLEGADKANYSVKNATATCKANITAKELTATITATSRAYDGTTDVAVKYSLADVISGEKVTATGTAAFADKNTGTDKVVTATGIKLDGKDKANYSLTNTTATCKANITAKELTVTGLTATPRAYDGTTDVTLTGGKLDGVIASDTVTATMPTTGTMTDAKVGTKKAVTFTAIALAGADAGNYSITQPIVTVDITAKDKTNITDAMITPIENQTYTGKVVEPTLTVKNGTTALTLGTDYTVAYANNTEVGTATVTVSGKGDYTGTIAKTFTITAKELTATITATSRAYDGTTDVAVKYSLADVISGEKVTATGTAAFADKNTGTDKVVTATGIKLDGKDKANYSLTNTTATCKANITAKKITPTIGEIGEQKYTGEAITPVLVVKDGETTLTLKTDYTVKYTDNTKAGKAKAIVTLIGNYSGTATANFTITKDPINLTNDMIEKIPDQKYTGEAIKPVLVVKNGTTELKLDTDYTVAYANNTKVGKATATITGIGDYTGKATASFEITKDATKLTNDMIGEIESQKYTGKEIKPALVVTDGDALLRLGTDYTAVYTDNIKVGTATATITGMGNYAGEATKTFKITKADGTQVKDYAVPTARKAITNVLPKLSNVTLDGKGDGVWAWNTDKDLTADNNNKVQTFKATFTPTDTKNYDTVEVDVKVSVSKLSIAIEGSKLRTLTKGTTEPLDNHITVVGAPLKEGTDYNTKLTVSKENIVTVADNEITANNVGTVKVTVDVMVGEIKAASDYIVAKVESTDEGEHSKNTADEIKDLTDDILNEENPPKELVNAIADATIKMDAEEKAKLDDETVKKLDKLFADENPELKVLAPIIEKKDGIENGISGVDAAGVALAAGLTSDKIKKGDTVQIKLEQEPPVEVPETRKAQMQVKLTLLVNGKKATLESPLVIDIQLDKNMKTDGLEIAHKHDDGKVDILTEGETLSAKNFIINKQTKVLTMRVTSFSTFTFTTAAEKPIDPTPSEPVDPTPSKPESSASSTSSATSSTASGTSSTTSTTSTKPSTPNTGDSSPLGAMAGVMLLGLAGIVGLVWKKKQDR